MKTDTATKPETFGARLLRLRTASGLTRAALAERIGVKRQTIIHIEKGTHGPRAVHLEHLADVFGVTMDDLWRGVGRCEKGAGA